MSQKDKYVPFLTPDLIKRLQWPVTPKQFAEAADLKPSTARMRLGTMTAGGEVIRGKGGLYYLPEQAEQAKADEGVFPDAGPYGEVVARLPQMPWPMSRKAFIEQVAQQHEVPKGRAERWFARMRDAGVLAREEDGAYRYRPPSEGDAEDGDAAPEEGRSDGRWRKYDVRELPPVFTSLQFAEHFDLTPLHTSRVLDRLTQRQHQPLTRLRSGLYASRPPLPLQFSTRVFADHFDLTVKAARRALAAHAKAGEVQALGDGQFEVSEDQRNALELAYWVDAEPSPFKKEVMRERIAELPKLKWPMTAEEYAEATGLNYHTARYNLHRFWQLGLLTKYREEGEVAYHYMLAPTPRMFDTPIRERAQAAREATQRERSG